MGLWDVEQHDGIVVADSTNAPMDSFVAQGAAELGALV